ncbi:MAG: hypothetical protein WC867_06350 [Candidatus Pacearchaeota archaeon]|jgi:hypothetical protein
MKNKLIFFIGIIFIFLISQLIIAVPPSFIISRTTTYSIEEQNPILYYNFSNNATDVDGNTFYFALPSINSSLYQGNTTPSFYYWISLNETTGMLGINSTRDNETGRFNISITVYEYNPDYAATTDIFYFIVNATNDAPYFNNLSSEYNLSQSQNSLIYLNLSDEENHYPLNVNISFFSNCSKASWSNRTNCTLFSLQNVANDSRRISWTPGINDIGTYYANFSITDSGSRYNCNSSYCASNYSQNITSYSGTVIFNILSSLDFDVTDCKNKLMFENQPSNCTINITSKGSTDALNISTIAALQNYGNTYISNFSWFYSSRNTTSVNNSLSLFVNITPTKTEVGNFSINFTVLDLTFNETLTRSIKIFVNRTNNDEVRLNNISDLSISTNSLIRINLTAYDNDHLIPDKSSDSLGGYNEVTSFSVNVLNASNLSQSLNGRINDFTPTITTMPIIRTNRTEARIEFIPNSTSFGNYTINITVRDRDNSGVSKLFNLYIINNNAPQWNYPLENILTLYEDNLSYFNFSMNITDPEGEALNFTFTNDTLFQSFNLNILSGVSSFTPRDIDIGSHLVTITVRDSWLTNTSIFNFSIMNIPDNVSINKTFYSTTAINATIIGNSTLIMNEDNKTYLAIWIRDDDLRIPLSQRITYNESFSINLTITGPNSTLFNLSPVYNINIPNSLRYETFFSPKKEDIGEYNISFIITDKTNTTDSFNFNITVLEVNHNPSLTMNNLTSAIRYNLYYRINATDIEDGDSTLLGNNNFTFSYNFISGYDFIKNNPLIFNKTNGIFNYTFNSSQGGRYVINVSVNDSSGLKRSDYYWIYVYENPNILFPPLSYQFNLIENISQNLSFQANQSTQTNLTYYVSVDYINSSRILINQSFYGNSSIFNYSLTPDFVSETYGIKNITLFVFPTEINLENRTNFNYSRTWNISINHTNDPMRYSGNIGGGSRRLEGGSPLIINLSEFFYDTDAADIYRYQTIGFSTTQNSTGGGGITITIINWSGGVSPSVSFASSVNAYGNYSINAFELNESNSSQVLNNISSNFFMINLTITSQPEPEPEPQPQPSSGGGSSSAGSSPISLKIITPGKAKGNYNQIIEVPITLQNKGFTSFLGVKLYSIGFKNGKISSDITTTLDKTSFASLVPGANENLTLKVLIKGGDAGSDYEVMINATSENPPYNDWAKITFFMSETNTSGFGENNSDTKRFLIFTEEFLVNNPECIELKELLIEAWNDYNKGEYANARAKSEGIVNACKDFISQPSFPRLSPNKYNIGLSLIGATLGSIILGVAYYSLKRRRFSKSLTPIEKKEENKSGFDFNTEYGQSKV